jgi:hypothetical protein
LKTETKTLEGLISLALQKNAFIPVSTAELETALNAVGYALDMIPLRCFDPATVKPELWHTLLLLANLVYAIDTRSLDNLSGNTRNIAVAVESVHKKLDAIFSSYYHDPYFRVCLLGKRTLLRKVSAITTMLKQDAAIGGLYDLLAPCLNEVCNSKKIPFQRWLWWLRFVTLIETSFTGGSGSLENILSSLGFNAPCYLHWLSGKLQDTIRSQASLAGKLDFIFGEILKYKNMDASMNGYFPGGQSVRSTMLLLLHAKLTYYKNAAVSGTAFLASDQSKINTAFSVPQLALFIRLLIDTQVINEKNNTGILKAAATIIGTPKTSAVSPESLRVNYYTPGTAAKNIVKDYLLQMINLLKAY